MPTYEYKCDSCGKKFEKFQSITSEPIAECPKCKGQASRQISMGSGIIFKGSGFHINDYKSSNTPSTAKPQAEKCESCAANKECSTAANK